MLALNQDSLAFPVPFARIKKFQLLTLLLNDRWLKNTRPGIAKRPQLGLVSGLLRSSERETSDDVSFLRRVFLLSLKNKNTSTVSISVFCFLKFRMETKQRSNHRFFESAPGGELGIWTQLLHRATRFGSWSWLKSFVLDGNGVWDRGKRDVCFFAGVYSKDARDVTLY